MVSLENLHTIIISLMLITEKSKSLRTQYNFMACYVTFSSFFLLYQIFSLIQEDKINKNYRMKA